MTLSEFFKNSWKSGFVTGAIFAYIVLRVQPFKSHLWLAVLAAVGVGILAGIIEVGARKITGRRRE